MTGRRRRPGDPYDVGYARPPQRTRFKKGLSGNPYGRPPKKPDFYTELTQVLHDTVIITFEGEPQQVTVQQALLLRLRDEALRGEVWAGKLLQKVVDAMPDGGSLYDHIEMEVHMFKALWSLKLIVDESNREKANQPPDPTEAGDGG
jgi:hypothetical protein